jgi:hypothetical protein
VIPPFVCSPGAPARLAARDYRSFAAPNETPNLRLSQVDVPAGLFQQCGVGIYPHNLETPRRKSLRENPGARADVEHAGRRQALDAERDNPVDLEESDPPDGSQALSLASKAPFVPHKNHPKPNSQYRESRIQPASMCR